jgi:hypothetical protein
MDNFNYTLVSVFISSVVLVVGIIIAVVNAGPTWQNLRRREVKDLLGLITEVSNRLEKDSANALRNSEIEDSLAKDLLVSQVFGRVITWSDWIKIRKFLTDHKSVTLDLLSRAWFYRDQTDASQIRFQMMPRIFWQNIEYILILLITIPSAMFGFMLMVISWLNSMGLQLPKWLISFGIHGDQLFALGAGIMLLALVYLIPNVIFNFDGIAARQVCEKLGEQVKPLTSR